MKSFAWVHLENGLMLIINTDYVVKIQPGLDPQEPTTVTLAGGEKVHLKKSEGTELIGQLNQCCEQGATGGTGGTAPKGSASDKSMTKPAPKGRGG